MNNKYDTIIVGAGVAGLTSAAYLAREGQRILLIEKNSVCGGLVNSFVRDGFHFDAGVRAIINAGIIKPMFDDLGIKIDTIPSKVSVGIGEDIIDIEKLENIEDYKNLLIKHFPGSKSEILQLMKTIRKVVRDMDILYGVDNPVFKDLKKDRDYLFKKLLPWLPGFLFTAFKINRMNNIPVEDYLEKKISDRALRDIISQHFFKNTPAFFALSYFSLYLDYFYPSEGIGTLAISLKDKVLQYGGEIKYKTHVERVSVGTKVVFDSNQNEYHYDNLIWAADLKTLYGITDTSGLDGKTKARIGRKQKILSGKRGGDSVFSMFIKVDEPLENFAEISNGHFFYSPLSKGLGDTHRAELDSLLDRWEEIDKEEVLKWLDKMLRYNTYEISVPGLKNKALVPEGKTGLIVSFLTEYNLFRKVAESGWYDEFKTEIEKGIVRVLTDSVYPFLKDKTLGSFSFTPLSIKDRVASSEGAITGWSFEKPIPAVNNILKVQSSVNTPFPSIYMAGQWTYSPSGVPMSILTGKLAADKIIK